MQTRRLARAQSVLLVAVLSGTAAGCASATEDSPIVRPALPVVSGHAELVSAASDVAELKQVAQVIVRAEAGDVRYVSDPTDPSFVTTYQSFQVTRTIKGGLKRGDSLTVQFLGGVVGAGKSAHLLEVEGQRQFEPGDDYLLALLGPTPQGTYFTIGGTQGRYRIVDERLRSEAGAGRSGGVEAELADVPVSTAVETLTPSR